MQQYFHKRQKTKMFLKCSKDEAEEKYNCPMNVLIVLTVEQNVSKNRAKSGRNRNCSTMFNYQFGVGEAEGRKRRLRIPFSCKEIILAHVST